MPTAEPGEEIPAASAAAKAARKPIRQSETIGLSGQPSGGPGWRIADTEDPADAAEAPTGGSWRAVGIKLGIFRAWLVGQLRRRIVIASLGVVLAVVIGGVYIGWQWSQDQYYLGADSQGQVVIYRGIDQRILGISLSRPYQATGIKLGQAPAPYQAAIKATDTVSSLRGAQAIVTNVRTAVATCRLEYTTLQDWVKQENAYRAALAQFQQNNKPAKDKPVAPPPQPAKPAPTCPASTAFGIPAGDLVPAASGSS